MSNELVRTLLIGGGFLAIGMNLAVIARMNELVRFVTAWRLYIAGQCFFDLAAIYGVRRHIHAPLGWTASFLVAAIGLTIGSLAMLRFSYRRSHSMKGH